MRYAAECGMIAGYIPTRFMSTQSAPTPASLARFLAVAESSARLAGRTLKSAFGGELEVDEKKTYDIKLALDRETQAFLEGHILAEFPDHVILGEEGMTGDQDAPYQWVIDPIDGTVNFFYGIPHFCISIALRFHGRIIVGMIHDPVLDETWTVVEGGIPCLNGRPIKVSDRDTLGEAIVTVGFSKSKASLDQGFDRYRQIAYEVRKTRLMGSAALAMAYIACGRLDAYIEEQISLWDIAAGQLLVEAAGGKVILRDSTDPGAPDGKMFICASNGRLPLDRYL